MWTASYQAEGKDAVEKGRDYFFQWVKTEGLFEDGKEHRFIAYYNHEKMGTKDFFYKINVTVDRDFTPKDENIKLEEFSGGYYAVMKSQYKYNGD